ncbi:MAG TPA: hypothetical protein VFS43_34460 [Polyangiaceae bacterium]|nr:hypothetical protein [Polyangiaceae bacterium]
MVFSLLAGALCFSCAAAPPAKAPAPGPKAAPAAAPPESTAPLEAGAAKAPILRHARLRYEPELSRAGIAAPLVDVTVRGVQATLLVDTGSAMHVLAPWLVRDAGLRSDEADGGLYDATGKLLPVSVLRDVSAELDGWGELGPAQNFISSPFPSVFERLRIGGLLSPQLLARGDETVMLDFREPSLWLEGPAARRRVAAAPATPATFCRSPVGRLDNLLFLTPVTIGRSVARLTLDSGAGATQLNESSNAGRLALQNSAPTPMQARGIAGRAVPLRVVENATVRLGSAEQRADVFVADVGSSYCAGEGRVGMDVLRSCRVGLGRSHFSISCLPTSP